MANVNLASDFIARYGERAYIVLRAIRDETNSNWPMPRLGDFSLKGLKSRIKSYGVDYNPTPLLYKLEREYGVIDTTYKSSNQHWWRVVDAKAIEEAVREYEGRPIEEAGWRVKLLKIQFHSLDPERIMEDLKRMASLRRLGESERRALRRIAFEDLPLIVRFLEEASSENSEELDRERVLAEKIVELAEAIIEVKLYGSRRAASHGRVEEPLRRRLGEA